MRHSANWQSTTVVCATCSPALRCSRQRRSRGTRRRSARRRARRCGHRMARRGHRHEGERGRDRLAVRWPRGGLRALPVGVNAYFDYVNACGGVYNRKIDLAYPLDDALEPDDGHQRRRDARERRPRLRHRRGLDPVLQRPQVPRHAPARPPSGTPPATSGPGPKNFFADYGSTLDFNSSIPCFAYVGEADQVDQGRRDRARLPLPPRTSARGRSRASRSTSSRSPTRTSTSRSAPELEHPGQRTSASPGPTWSSAAWT